MIDPLFAGFRRATESTLQMQRDLLRHWSQPWLLTPLTAMSTSTAWYRSWKRRWFDLTIAAMKRHHEAMDLAYRSSIELLEHGYRLAEAVSADEARQIAEAFWRKVFGAFKAHSEAHFRELREWSEMSLDLVNEARGSHANGKAQTH